MNTRDISKSVCNSVLFDQINIDGLNLKNRFVMSATGNSKQTQDGYVSELTINHYLKMAQGGVALIIAGAANIQKSSRIDYQLGAHSDDFIPGLKALVDRVHLHDTKIALQLNSYGFTPRAAEREGREDPVVAPSIIDNTLYRVHKHRAMTLEEIEQTIESFGEAARRGKQSGFDAVQIHMAHGYLLSQFLSPFTNHRRDKYGGDHEGRMRIHLEILDRVREKVGEDYPLLVKLGVKDEVESEGLSLKEGCQVAKALSDFGLAAIEVSQGLDTETFQSLETQIPLSYARSKAHIRRNILKRSEEAYYLDWCKQVRKVTSTCLFLVGGLRSFDIMEDIIQSGAADCISMSRPFIREPALVKRWLSGDLTRARCISCNECMQLLHKYRPLSCIQEQKLLQRARAK